MKPLLVLAADSQEPSGMGEHMLMLARALQERYRIVVACAEGGEGAAFLHRAAIRGFRIKALDATYPDTITAWLKKSGASLLHVHAGISWEGHELVRCGKAAGLPVIRTEHLPYLLTDPVQKAAYRAMLLSVDRRIAVSEAVLRSYAEQGGGRLALVRNGIGSFGEARSSRAETRSALGFAGDDRLLLTVARFTPQKGHRDLIAAVPAVLARVPRAKFILVGRGPEQPAIEAAIGEAGLGDAVRLLGQRDDVPELLAAADLFVLPSHFEGLPIALLEAMALGVPIVATAIGGTLEALGAKHPHLAQPGSPGDLARCILDALEDMQGTRAAAEAVRARFVEQFSAERMARETAALYDTILQAEARKGAGA